MATIAELLKAKTGRDERQIQASLLELARTRAAWQVVKRTREEQRKEAERLRLAQVRKATVDALAGKRGSDGKQIRPLKGGR